MKPVLYRQILWAVWGGVTLLLAGLAVGVWSTSCACGYQTSRGLFTSVALAVSAWVGLFLPGSRAALVRVALVAWVILTTVLLGRHLADVLWFSPHALFAA